MNLSVLAGHYGSGKTQLAVNMAISAKKTRDKVVLCDIDIVNPYFRSIDCQKVLLEAGVRLISSAYAGGNAEMPGLPPEAAVIFDTEGYAVVDVGGDERGALVLGRYAERMRDTAEMLLVVNRYRPLTRRTDELLEVCREIERASRLRFTGLVNNSNLGEETTAGDVLEALPYAKEIAERLSLPIRYTTVKSDLTVALGNHIPDLYPITIFHKPEWRIEN